MVDIYLPIEDRQILALSIPSVDIERLSLHPVKWLRFLLFTICGVRGDLTTTPNGPPVDYDASTVDNMEEAYYFAPEGDYHLIDFHAIDDPVTFSAQTLCSSTFRSDIIARDDRQHLYDLNEESVDLGINSVENGMLLSPDLHRLFAAGSSAFLVTPNFALQPADVPPVETGPMPSRRITLQHFEVYTNYHVPTPQFDACMSGTGTPRPSTIILDYMYGVAGYKRWGTGQEIKNLMQQRFTESYEPIPIPPAPPHTSDDGDIDTSPEILQAMDDILALSMLLKGTTPELMAAERQRQAEAEELRVKEASKLKVRQWMRNSESVESTAIATGDDSFALYNPEFNLVHLKRNCQGDYGSQHTNMPTYFDFPVFVNETFSPMVDVYLPIEGQQILALSIPFVDVERLSLRPVKWLRYLIFTICGVRGDLPTTHNGPPVDYDTSTLDNMEEAYHFVPQGDYRFIDSHAIDDRGTSSAQTLRSSSFRSDIITRDGPYLEFVLRDRQHLYDLNEESVDLGINSVENGMLLSPDLHSFFAAGISAFLKTPNFALQPADIPRVETGPMPPRRITLQHFRIVNRAAIPQYDACITGTGTSPLSTIILDYMYGVAGYRRWGIGQKIKELMERRFTESYASIPIPPTPPSPRTKDDSDMESDDSKKKQKRRRHSDMSPEMLQAMDDILALSMLMKGRTPKSMAAEAQRQEKVEELRAKEASKVKVQQWMQNSDSCCRDFDGESAALD
ncbi:uncharacterized protein LACBIDRAFT_332334 [Laccaria bicolor S238N-H82]|uniref:Predicted protein n=1 Tax=Laccaria bicolor (strain S238N-H82 / ATCC MYA-4686) TaxID=486041 RepID=B0DSE0_LACBS|nr:uncharacterized protein LACBIDRAFT_332334 [Laccaria bicolor S238N-H82]EDR02529.1 predicted protein [Laccaria bicolor S238N-H82]|eukprot:XP_001886892.1 predicted protein [Laccaria bicolor S238N-H82]